MLRLLIKSCWTTFVVIVVAAAFIFSLIRLLLPVVGEYRQDIESWINDAMGQPLTIGALEAKWRGLYPSLRLHQVSMLDQETKRPLLVFDEVYIDVDLLGSVFNRRFEPGTITLVGLDVSVVRGEDGDFTIGGVKAPRGAASGEKARKALQHWFLSRKSLSIRKAAVRWQDLAKSQSVMVFSDLDFTVNNADDRHQISGQGVLPQRMGQAFQFAVDAEGDALLLEDWGGQVYLKGDGVRLDSWLAKKELKGLQVEGGSVDFQLWSAWQQGAITEVDGEIRGHDLHLVSNLQGADDSAGRRESLTASAVTGRVNWVKRADGWALNVSQFVLATLDHKWRPTDLGVTVAKNGDTTIVEVGASYLPAPEVSALLRMGEFLDAKWVKTLNTVQPRGELHDSYLRIVSSANQELSYFTRSGFHQLGLSPWEKVPGFSGLSGVFYADENTVLVELATKEANLQLPKLFREPLPIGQLDGKVTVQRSDGGGWYVRSKKLDFRNEHIILSATLGVELPPQGGSPVLDLEAKFEKGKVEFVSRYLPVGIMKKRLVDWLDRAIVSGELSSGSAVVSGPINRFPFVNKEGRFEVHLNINDGILDYVQKWPRLEEIDAEVVFNRQALTVRGSTAKTLDSTLADVTATISDLRSKRRALRVLGRATGPSSDGIRYLVETPLYETVGKYFSDARIEGRSNLELSLRVPLNKFEKKTTISGEVYFVENDLWLEDAGVDVTQINGALRFSDEGVEAQGIDAVIMGQPATASIVTERAKQSPAMTTVITASGQTTPARLYERFELQVFKRMQGATRWDGVLRLHAGEETRQEVGKLTITSRLEGVEVMLPEPVGKRADKPRNVLFTMSLPIAPDRPMRLQYGEALSGIFEVERTGEELDLLRGELRYGGVDARLPDGNGLRIAGNLPRFDEEQWRAKTADAGGGGQALDVLTEIEVVIAEAQFFGRTLQDVTVSAVRDTSGWQAAVDSAKLTGVLKVPDQSDAPLVLDLEHFYLETLPHGESSTMTDPRTLPPIHVKSKQFSLDEMNFGTLNMVTTRIPTGLRVSSLSMENGPTRIEAQGDWVVDAGEQTSSLNINLDSANMGQTLAVLGYADTIHEGTSRAEISARWSGAPGDFSMARLNGHVQLKIDNGRLLEVEPGAGRIFGLLSLQALPRRLALDFSDFFAKGFSFDKIRGGFTIEDGKAHTDNLTMEGPAASVSVTGRIDLAEKRYDQRVKVVPNVTAPLPITFIAIGVVTNPVAGVAAWLAEKLIRKPVGTITQVTYNVTGSWDDPVIERVSRADLTTETTE